MPGRFIALGHGQHAVRPCVGRVVGLHGLKNLGKCQSQVTRLARVIPQVVKMPLAVAHGREVFDDFQVALEECEVARHLIADRLVGGMYRMRSVVQRRQQAGPAECFDRLAPVAAAGAGQPGQCQQRRRDVRHMGEAMINLTLRHARNPGNDERHPDATFARVELVGVQWRDGSAGPAWPGNAVGALAAQPVYILAVLRGQPELTLGVVGAFGAVVRQKHEDRVVELAGGLEVRDQSPDMLVHGLGHGGINLHLPRRQAFFLLAKAVPTGHRWQGRHRCVPGYQAKFCRLVPPRLAQCTPAAVVAAPVFFNQLARRLYRHMVGLKGQVGEKRFAAAGAGVDEFDGPVDKVPGGVELCRHHGGLAVLEPIDLGRHRQVALGRLPVVRAGVALDDGAVKAALVRSVVGLRANVPLAAGVGAVAAVAQQRGDGHDPLVQRAQIARLAHMLARHGFPQIAHAVEVVVNPGQQHGAAW